MVRPSKRRKVKNPSAKTSRKAKNPYNISFAGVHPLVKANWDKKLTLRQNYERMGLISALNGKAGGEAIMERPKNEEGDQDDEDVIPVSYVSYEDFEKMPAVSAGGRSAASTAAAKDQEDDSADDDQQQDDEPAHAMDDDNSDSEEESEQGIESDVEIDPRSTHIGVKLGLRLPNPTSKPHIFPSRSTKRSIKPLPFSVAEAMQELCKDGDVPVVRHASENETQVLMDLIKKYGEGEYEAMARDRKLNPFQLTAGQLKKKISKLNR
ncbi:hypothetical protein HDV05_003351 [Chytridiales sp. JEL 0842]|nr:hypothetical protein HDV05_003351 [Chytridiales sp. JEL 0842]